MKEDRGSTNLLCGRLVVLRSGANTGFIAPQAALTLLLFGNLTPLVHSRALHSCSAGPHASHSLLRSLLHLLASLLSAFFFFLMLLEDTFTL